MAHYENGAHTIGLFQDIKNIITFNPGWNNDAQPLNEFTDVRQIQRQLKDRGIPILKEADEQSSGPANCMMADPDGNLILLDQHI